MSLYLEIMVSAAVALLALVAGLQWRSRYQTHNADALRDLRQAVGETIMELDASIRQHVQVAAVVALLEEHQDRPELFAELASYSRQVVSAALFHRVNSLASALQAAQDNLARSYDDYAHNPQLYADLVSARERWVARLEAQLRDAEDAARVFGTTHSVP